MKSNYPNRKPMRLPNFDYSAAYAYFVTICTDQKKPLFWTNQKQNRFGDVEEAYLRDIPNIFPNSAADCFVVMPNHVHAIIQLSQSTLDSGSTLSTIVGTYKSGVSRKLHRFSDANKVWQRGFYDHVIRDQEEYLKIWNYIEENPIRWCKDALYIDTFE